MIKIVYRVLSLVFGVVGGILAGKIFEKTWKLAARQDEAPKADDASRGWPEIVLAAAVQGAITAAVRAAVSRSAAAGTRRLTGTWPGKTGGEA